ARLVCHICHISDDQRHDPCSRDSRCRRRGTPPWPSSGRLSNSYRSYSPSRFLSLLRLRKQRGERQVEAERECRGSSGRVTARVVVEVNVDISSSPAPPLDALCPGIELGIGVV